MIVDNCEHVVDRAAEVVDGLLSAAPDLRVLATSREALHLHGEPARGAVTRRRRPGVAAAVRLFTERAPGRRRRLDRSPTIDLDGHGDHSPARRHSVGDRARRRHSPQPSRRADPHAPRRSLRIPDARQRGRRRRVSAPSRPRSRGRTSCSTSAEQFAFRRLAVSAGRFTLGTAARLLGVDELGLRGCLDDARGKVADRAGPLRRSESGLPLPRDAPRLRPARARPRHMSWPRPRWRSRRRCFRRRSCSTTGSRSVNDYIVRERRQHRHRGRHPPRAGRRALDAGRLDAAALIFSSCAFRDDPGAFDTTLRLVAPLAERRRRASIRSRGARPAPPKWGSSGSPAGTWRASTTAVDMLAVLDADDPSRGWFDVWRCALTTAVAPEDGVDEIDDVLPVVRANARAPHDFTLSQLLATKATGLAVLRRLDEARATTKSRSPGRRSGRKRVTRRWRCCSGSST